MKKSSVSKFTLVLDLDETLVSMVEDKDKEAYNNVYKNSDIDFKSRCFSIMLKEKDSSNKVVDVKVTLVKRKGFDEFIAWAFKFFSRVCIWSAGTSGYVYGIKEKAFYPIHCKPDVTFTRNECTEIDEVYLKPLDSIISKMTGVVSKDKVFILEDRFSSVVEKDRGNIGLVKKFSPKWKESKGIHDNELTRVREWFEAVHDSGIRTITELGLCNGIMHPIESEEYTDAQVESDMYTPYSIMSYLTVY